MANGERGLMSSKDFISTAVRIRSVPRRKTSDENHSENNKNTPSVYFVQNKITSRNLDGIFDEDNSYGGEEIFNDVGNYNSLQTTILEESDELAVDSNIVQSKKLSIETEFDDNRNIINENMIERHRNKSMPAKIKTQAKQLGGVSLRVSASADKLYENGKFFSKLSDSDMDTSNNSLNDSLNNRPKKPKRTLKFDRDRCTFIKGSSVDDMCQDHLLLSQEEFDAFIASEKRKFSGVVENAFDISIASMDSGVSFNDLAPWIRETYLERLEMHIKNKPIINAHSSEQVISERVNERGNTSDYTLENSPRQSLTSYPNSIESLSYDYDVWGGSLINRENLSQKWDRVDTAPPKMELVEQVLDNQIEQLENLLIDISMNGSISNASYCTSFTNDTEFNDVPTKILETNSINYYIEPQRRTELPAIPEENYKLATKKFLRRRGTSIRSTLKHARRRIVQSSRVKRSGPKITIPVLNRSFRLPIRKCRASNEKQAVESVRSSAEIKICLYQKEKEVESQKSKIEEERLRLSELKKSAAVKAELEWNEKKREQEQRKNDEKDIASKKEHLEALKAEQQIYAEEERKSIILEAEKIRKQEELLKQREQELSELHKERDRREELEKLLQSEKDHEISLERSLSEEKERLTTLEKSFVEERSKRVKIEQKLHEEEERNKSIMIDRKKLSPDTSNSGTSSDGNGTFKRSAPSYTLSIRSGHDQEMNLLQHITDAGHLVDNCPIVRINRYSCRGYLLKMGQRFNISWKKRWFVFDRKLRALCYYQDERRTKSRGILYFQSIQEVYVDSGIRRSPNPKTTFCVRTQQRTYVLNASTPIAMSIWIDVIMTGREGALMSMTL